MNIFALDDDPQVAAKMHCDKHIVKMIIEYAQLMSTAHRLLDGKLTGLPPLRKKVWLLPGEALLNLDGKLIIDSEACEFKCYKATHINHPAAVWTRKTSSNYLWLFELFSACLAEYTARYERKHKTERLVSYLSTLPKNIPLGLRTQFPQAMPTEYHRVNSVEAYRAFYVGDKVRFARWARTSPPKWFTDAVSQRQ